MPMHLISASMAVGFLAVMAMVGDIVIRRA